jgi:2-polyprenyl-3-methyl-5-hydroxy-6-metoxy-1,4-benzoquinol methylase
MDRDVLSTLQSKAIIKEIGEVIDAMKKAGVSYSNWYGTLGIPKGNHGILERINRGRSYEPWDLSLDDVNVPWFLLWEICWLLTHASPPEGGTVLDLGGASSLFSCLLASRGHKVIAVDLSPQLVRNGNHIAQVMGWQLQCIEMDMRALALPMESFDMIYSVCVYEHIPWSDRIPISKQISRLLKPGGMFAITFDYLNPVKEARINSPEDVREQFVKPSGLSLAGNAKFHDNGKRYLEWVSYYSYYPELEWVQRWWSFIRGEISLGSALNKNRRHYTFGALFLKKDQDTSRETNG